MPLTVMVNRYIVVHKMHGIFLGMVGEVSGMFSLLDPCGIYLTIAFDNIDFVKRLMSERFPFKLEQYRLSPSPAVKRSGISSRSALWNLDWGKKRL
jgi:hypothetical protein